MGTKKNVSIAILTLMSFINTLKKMNIPEKEQIKWIDTFQEELEQCMKDPDNIVFLADQYIKNFN